MGYVGEIFEITSLSVSASPIVYGASVAISYKLKNIYGAKIVKLGASVRVNRASFDPALSGAMLIAIDGHDFGDLGNAISFANGATKSFSYAFSFVDSSIAALFAQYPNVRSVPLELYFSAQDADGWGIGGTYAIGNLLGMRYLPSVPALAARRDPTEESEGAAVDIRCALADGANPQYPGLALTLQWKEAYAATFPGENALSVTVADALATNGTAVNPNFVFEAGKAYTLRATFTDGIDSGFSETVLAKSFAVFDVSPDGFGFAVGQYATGTEESPKFESAYPIIGYDGFFDGDGGELIPPVDYSAARVSTGASWTDGKAIYRKVLTFTSLGGGATKDVSLGESAISTCVRLAGMAYNTGGGGGWDVLPLASPGSTYNIALYMVSPGSNPYIRIQSGSAAAKSGGHIVVDYTLPT